MTLKYSVENYDENHCLKLSGDMWLIILFLLRPILVIIISVLNREDRSAFINMVYADKMILWWGLLAAVPAVFVIYAMKKRKPGATPFARKLWHRGRELLAASALFGIAIVFVPLWIGVVYQVGIVGWIQFAISLGIVVVLYSSPYIRDCFSDYPKETDTEGSGSS